MQKATQPKRKGGRTLSDDEALSLRKTLGIEELVKKNTTPLISGTKLENTN